MGLILGNNSDAFIKKHKIYRAAVTRTTTASFDALPTCWQLLVTLKMISEMLKVACESHPDKRVIQTLTVH